MSVDRVFLLGYMGSGKSTLGRRIASALGWRFIDMDDYIETKLNRTISQIFSDNGEAGFRVEEQAALKELCREEKCIIATGGGAPCFFDNIDQMNDSGLSIYLKVSPESLFNRIRNAKEARPLIASKSDDELLAFIKDKLEEREPFYKKAKVVAVNETLSVDTFVEVIRKSEKY